MTSSTGSERTSDIATGSVATSSDNDVSASTSTSDSSENNTSDDSAQIDVAEFAAGLDGYLYRGECNGGSASFECPLSACQGGVFEHKSEVTIGGQPELVYAIELHVYGVTELRRDYHDGERRQMAKSNAQSAKDFFYAGGAYTKGTGYNVYALRVEPAVADVAAAENGGNNYFLNARDESAEGHEVWELNYEATLLASGGSTITFTAYDPNCLQIMNNQETARPSAGSGPNGAIVIAGVEAASPPPVDFEQPLSTSGRTGQWVYIDVLNVTVER